MDDLELPFIPSAPLIDGHLYSAAWVRKPSWHAADCPVPRLKRKYDQRGRALPEGAS